MASILSEINWIANGERADSVTLNRPLLEFLSKWEAGLIEVSTSTNSIVLDPSVFDASVSDGMVVSLNTATGKIVKSEFSNKEYILGIVDVTTSRIYTSGIINKSLLDGPNGVLTLNTKYYLDYTAGNEGLLRNSTTADEPYIGLTLDFNGAAANGEKFMIKLANGGAASYLSQLLDVTLTTSTTGDFLQFDGTNWINDPSVDGGAY